MLYNNFNGSPIDALGYQEIALSDAVQTLADLAGDIPLGAKRARIQVLDGGAGYTNSIVRFTQSPSIDPNVSFGQILEDKDYIMLENEGTVNTFRFISAEAGKAGILAIQFFKG